MNRLAIAAVAVSLSLALHARAEDKTYDLKLQWKAEKGQKFTLDSREDQKMSMKIKVGGEVMQSNEGEEKIDFEGTVEVLDAAEGKATKLKANFSKATRKARQGEEDAEKTEYGFHGKTVVATKDGEEWGYTYEDGSEVDEADVKGLAKALDLGRKKGQKKPEEVFAPKNPVKVGESWEPNIEDVIAGFGEGDEVKFDASKSSATFKLVSVETKNGAEVGRIEGVLNLAACNFGPLELAEPIAFEIEFNVETVIDGTRPDGTMEAKMKVKGERTASMPNGQEIDIEVDMAMKSKETKALAK